MDEDSRNSTLLPSSCSQSQNPQDIGANESPPEVCLRCSKVIEHIPYKYKGHTFHAICIICNFCGKKLIAKPFIVDGSNIFCSDQCVVNFEGAASVIAEPILIQPKEDLSSEGEGESLMEVLENIQEGGEEMMKLLKKPSPLPKRSYDPDRITDYPRAKSPEVIHSLSPPVNEDSRLSVSTISESSLTSDGSSIVSYDANRMPKKKILKQPHRMRKRSKNRVRWNLPGSEDSDTASLQSFDSASTTASEIYSQSRSSVSNVMRNWREFERSPKKGSTGLTPVKPLRDHQYYYVSDGIRSHSSSSLFGISSSPLPSSSSSSKALALRHSLLGGSHYVYKSRSASTSSLPQVPVNGTASSPRVPPPPQVLVNGKTVLMMSSDNQKGFRRTPSPLAISAGISSPSASPPRKSFQSTPKSYHHHQSDSSLSLRSRKDVVVENTRRNQSDKAIDSQNDIDMPVLKLDNSNLSELEESTLEDRKKMHIFQFPQNTPAKSTWSSRMNDRVFQDDDDDDDDDYDHLRPLHTAEKKGKKKDAAIELLSNYSKKKQKKGPKEEEEDDDDVFTDKDINDALEKIAHESDTGNSLLLSPSIEEIEECPPPVPAKVRANLKGKKDLEKSHSASLSEEMEPPPVLVEEVGELNWKVNHASLCSSSLKNEVEKAKHDHILAPADRENWENIVSDDKDKGKGKEETIPPKAQELEEIRHVREEGTEIVVTRVEEKTEVTANRTEEMSPKTEGMTNVSPRTSEGVADVPPKKTEELASVSPRTEITAGTSPGTGKRANASPRRGRGVRTSHKKTEKRMGDSTREEETVSSMKSSESITPPLNGEDKRTGAGGHRQPPPVPPKTKRIRRKDRDTNGNPIAKNNQSNTTISPPKKDLVFDINIDLPPPVTDDADVEDILPPPPQFAFAKFTLPPPPRFSPPTEDTEVQRHGWTTPPEESLTSVSNSTLVPDTEEQSDMRQNNSETDRDDSISPPPPDHRINKHSWSAIHYKKVRDRVTEINKVEDKLSLGIVSSTVGNSSLDCQPAGSTDLNSEQLDDHRVSDNRDRTNSQPLPSSDGLLPLLTQHPSHRRSYRNHIKEKGKKSDDQMRRILPHRPAPPPPPPLSSSKIKDKPSLEECQHVHPSNGKPHVMKTVVHDAERHNIQEVLAEVDIEGRRPDPAFYGVCGNCSTAVQSSKELCVYDGLCYHTKCYKCITCNVALQGKKIFRLRASLLCRECCTNYDSKLQSHVSTGNSHRKHKISKHPPRDLHGPSVSGGQVTSV